MNIIYVVLFICIAYFLLVFIGLRFLIPFMGFKEPKIPEELPQEVKNTIENLKSHSHNAMQYLKAAYDFRNSRWHTDFTKTITKFPLSFRKSFDEFWQTNGFMHCNTMNYILYVLLIKSGYFNKEDVRFRYTIQNLFIHQYIQVKIKDKWINIDTKDKS